MAPSSGPVLSTAVTVTIRADTAKRADEIGQLGPLDRVPRQALVAAAGFGEQAAPDIGAIRMLGDQPSGPRRGPAKRGRTHCRDGLANFTVSVRSQAK